MSQNPYKYKGPLDPVKDELVCIPWDKDIEKVIAGVMAGDYWSVMGPKHIGKTTFLRQVKHRFSNAHCLYVHCNGAYKEENTFYQFLENKFQSEIPPGDPLPIQKGKKDHVTDLKFLDFLRKFKPKDRFKKIVLLFDDIDNLPFIGSFLRFWRKVYIDRYSKKELNRYGVIITGSVNIIGLTIGPTSPFNVAEHLYIRDFSDEESERLIAGPFGQLDIKIEPQAKEHLVSQISGHPQMLQHACYILVEKAAAANNPVTEKDVDNAINILFAENLSLNTLKQQLQTDKKIESLVKNILSGKTSKYHPYKEFSISGAGPIVEQDFYCSIRNKVYERFLEKLLENPKIEKNH
jgi:hypothetical protein